MFMNYSTWGSGAQAHGKERRKKETLIFTLLTLIDRKKKEIADIAERKVAEKGGSKWQQRAEHQLHLRQMASVQLLRITKRRREA